MWEGIGELKGQNQKKNKALTAEATNYLQSSFVGNEHCIFQ